MVAGKNTRVIRCGPKFYQLTRGLKTEFNLSEPRLTDELASFLEHEQFIPIMTSRARRNMKKRGGGLFT